MDVIAPKRPGNIPQKNCNKKVGWANYSLAPAIKALIKTHPEPNARQKAFKELTFKLDMETFRIKHRKLGSKLRKNNEFRKSKIKEITDYVNDQHKAYADNFAKMHRNINTCIWAAKEIINAPKQAIKEKNAINDPITGDLLTDPVAIKKATLNYNVKPEMDEKIKQHDCIMAGKIKKDTDS